MIHRPLLTCCCAFGLSLLGACSGGGGGSAGVPETTSEVFDYSSSAEVELALNVTLDGLPGLGARVQIVDALPALAPGEIVEDVISGSLYWDGLVDSEGDANATLKLPTAVTHVDVIVQLVGARGPYTIEEYRAEWGPFAPSARWTLTREQLNGATIALWSN